MRCHTCLLYTSEAGSTYAVVDEAAYAPAGDTRYILVDNCLHTLQQLANYHRRQLGTRMKDVISCDKLRVGANNL